MPEFVKRNVIVLVYSALLLSTLLVFWQVHNFDFARYDDNEYVYENPHVLNSLSIDSIIWAFITGYTGNWHPLTWLSLMLDCQLFDANPGRMHLVNLFLHLANTLLLFAVLRKMTAALWPSAFVAAAFALHPMHVESVAWIAERKDVLSTLFLLLTLAVYVSYVRRRGLFRYLLTLLLFALGLMSKPMLVTLPFLLLLLDYWPLNRFSVSNRKPTILNSEFTILNLLYEKIPFFVLSIASSVITFLVQHDYSAVADFNALPLEYRITNVLLSYVRYTVKLFWPRNLAVFYPFDADKFASWQVMICVLLLFGISIFVIHLGRNHKYLPVGWFWFVGTLVPVIGIVQVGMQAYADRYTYIPYIGLLLMIAWGLPELFLKWPQRKIVLGLSMVIVLTILGICTHRQVGFWNDIFTLFSHTLNVTQNNFLAHNALGAAYNNIGRYQDSIESNKRAIKCKPDYAVAYVSLGATYQKLGRYHDAIESYKRAIKMEPGHADVYYNLGISCGELGRWQDAIEPFKQAISIKQDFTDAYFKLGVTYDKLGRHKDAIASWKQAVIIKPDFAEAYSNIGAVFHKLGRYQDAIEPFKQAIRIKPDLAVAHYNLGAIYANLGRYQDAIESYKQTVKIKPDFADAHFNLGVVYLAVGDQDSALEEYKILKTLDAKQADQLYNLIHK